MNQPVMNQRIHQQTVTVPTPGPGLVDVTRLVSEAVEASSIWLGLCHVFLQHTSASLVIQENADPDVLRDLHDWMARLAPAGDPRYRHVEEGPDDMSAHLRAAITQTSLTIPVVKGRLGLGVWQGIYVFEHRDAPHVRHAVVTVQGSNGPETRT